MSIVDYRWELSGVPGVERMLMSTVRLDSGGEADEFSIDDRSVRVAPGAEPSAVKMAFLDAVAK